MAGMSCSLYRGNIQGTEFALGPLQGLGEPFAEATLLFRWRQSSTAERCRCFHSARRRFAWRERGKKAGMPPSLEAAASTQECLHYYVVGHKGDYNPCRRARKPGTEPRAKLLSA
jgi:hypothetical protein